MCRHSRFRFKHCCWGPLGDCEDEEQRDAAGFVEGQEVWGQERETRAEGWGIEDRARAEGGGSFGSLKL